MSEFDLGPLSWVKGEIDQSLSRAREAINEYTQKADPTVLRFARTHLHQAHGALAMVNLDGAPVISQLLESLLQQVAEQKHDIKAVLPLIDQALNQLRHYLDDLMAGELPQPLKLATAYLSLCQACGLRPGHPADLFFPDLSVRAPKRDDLKPLTVEAQQAILKPLRARYQKGLLTWLKSPQVAEARATMESALAAIEETQNTPTTRTFWWVAQGFIESLSKAEISNDLRAKQLCLQIDQQIKQLLNGQPSLSEKALREALYFVAVGPENITGISQQIRSTFSLSEQVPVSQDQHANTECNVIPPRARELLIEAEMLWGKICAGNRDLLTNFHACILQSAELINPVGHTDLKRLSQAVVNLTEWIKAQKTKDTLQQEALSMEMATAILLMQHACEHYQSLTHGESARNFPRQVDLMVARLHLLMAGKRPDPDTELVLDDYARRAQEKLVVSQVAREIRQSLGQVEQYLDTFFRDATQREPLSLSIAPLKQVAGAFAMLGHFGASGTLKDCLNQLQTMQADPNPPLPEHAENLAQQLSLVGFFAEALQQGETDYPAFVRKFLTGGPVDETEDEPALVAPLASPAPETITSITSILAETEAIVEESPLTDLPPVQPTAAPEPTEATKALVQASEATIDAELLDIFLMEATEVLQTMDDELLALATPPHPQDSLTAIRRATHTLKGSGRMVGLKELGETAWEIEQTLNLWLRQEKPANEALFTLLETTHQVFSNWVAHLQDARHPLPDPTALVTQAIALREETPDALPPALETTPIPQTNVLSFPGTLHRHDDEATEAAPLEENETPLPMATVTALPTREELQLAATADALSEFILPAEVPSPTLETEEALEPPEAPDTPEDEVPAGQTIKVSPALFQIFIGEAAEHLATLTSHLANLHANPDQPVQFAMHRAAHTLGGIAATVGQMPIHHLGLAIERYLLRRDSATPDTRAPGLDLLDEAMATLNAQFEALSQDTAPADADDLINRLDALDALATAVDYTPVDLPEETPAQEAPTPTPLPSPAYEVPVLEDELDEQLLPLFLEEAEDQLPKAHALLASWKQNPADTDPARQLRRILHTFKGNARMAGAMNLGELSHLLESRIEQAKTETTTAGLFEEIQAALDTLTHGVDALRHPEKADTIPATLPPAENTPPAPLTSKVTTQPTSELTQSTLRVRADLLDELVNDAGELAIVRSRIEGEMRTLKTSLLDLTENVIRLRRQLRDIEIEAESQIQSGANTELTTPIDATFDPLELDRYTRFQELTRFMAESVNDVATVQQTLLKSLDDTQGALLAQSRLNKNLQQELMGIRMLPFNSQSERLYRITRQTARDTGKRARLDIVGGQITLDRTVLEKVLGPIEHMLRNALTHGIESPDERKRLQKDETGEITLRVSQEGNEICLALQDDGKGLDLTAIREQAIERHLIQATETLNDQALYALIFEPGFSTATELTQIAGRGVGMDVVKTEITALGGRTEINSTPGEGTTFRLYLPLTLAVTSTLLIRTGESIYALPATMIEQILDLREKPLQALQAAEHYVWQGHQYTYRYLPHLLGDTNRQASVQRQTPILLLRAGTQRVALHVDELLGNQEVVVKNIGPQLARVPGVDGATVLGDGRIVLIINPPALLNRMHTTPTALTTETTTEHRPCILVVDDSLTVRKITGRLLSREGFEVRVAKDGIEAMESLFEQCPDAVVTDIEMPRMDGFELIRNIRNESQFDHLPIIVITSRTADKHRQHALELGANHYLGKPYDDVELINLLEKHKTTNKA